METTTLALIFAAVWIGIVALFCCFKFCGGRVVDCVSCDCFEGPFCDCWGAGGQIDRYDREFPDWLKRPPPNRLRRGGELPAVVLVQKEHDGGDSSSDSDGEGKGERGPPALLLNTDRRQRERKRDEPPVVV